MPGWGRIGLVSAPGPWPGIVPGGQREVSADLGGGTVGLAEQFGNDVLDCRTASLRESLETLGILALKTQQDPDRRARLPWVPFDVARIDVCEHGVKVARPGLWQCPRITMCGH